MGLLIGLLFAGGWQSRDVQSTGLYYAALVSSVIDQGYWMLIERSREKSMVDLASGSPWETVTFTTFGRNRQLFLDILQEARDMALSKEEGKTLIYTANGFEWKEFGQPRARRPLSSVILDKDHAERLANDLKEFLANQSWYRDRGAEGINGIREDFGILTSTYFISRYSLPSGLPPVWTAWFWVRCPTAS